MPASNVRRVTGLVLRGICLMRDCEIDWMFRGGVATVYPEAWRRFKGHLSEEEQRDPLLSYYRRLTSEDASTRSSAVSATIMTSNIFPSPHAVSPVHCVCT
jgi:proline iminopeptidase